MKKLVKDAILNEFINLCGKKNIDKITIKDITTAAGISKQTFYNYFRDKDDLMNYLFFSETTNQMYNDLTKENFVNMVAAFILKMKHHQKYYRAIFNYETQNSFSKAYEQITYEYYSRHIVNKNGESALTKLVVDSLEFYIGGSYALLYRWINNGAKESPEMIAETLYACVPPAMKSLI